MVNRKWVNLTCVLTLPVTWPVIMEKFCMWLKRKGWIMTLQKKLNDNHVKHPNLYMASVLPENLSAYDFIFLDSVNRLGFTSEDLNRLKAANPAKSFVFIFQSTKNGNFRGENSFQHDVDVVIEVPEKGKAVQMGRFNQGGEMPIF